MNKKTANAFPVFLGSFTMIWYCRKQRSNQESDFQNWMYTKAKILRNAGRVVYGLTGVQIVTKGNGPAIVGLHGEFAMDFIQRQNPCIRICPIPSYVRLNTAVPFSGIGPILGNEN